MADKSKEVEPVVSDLVPTVLPGSPELEEVKRDAERITLRRLKEQQEDREYKESKKKA